MPRVSTPCICAMYEATLILQGAPADDVHEGLTLYSLKLITSTISKNEFITTSYFPCLLTLKDTLWSMSNTSSRSNTTAKDYRNWFKRSWKQSNSGRSSSTKKDDLSFTKRRSDTRRLNKAGSRVQTNNAEASRRLPTLLFQPNKHGLEINFILQDTPAFQWYGTVSGYR